MPTRDGLSAAAMHLCSFVFSFGYPIKILQTTMQVDERLLNLKETAIANKNSLDRHVSSMECITKDAKRKWKTFSMRVENNATDSADFSAAQHCSMELLLQQRLFFDECLVF